MISRRALTTGGSYCHLSDVNMVLKLSDQFFQINPDHFHLTTRMSCFGKLDGKFSDFGATTSTLNQTSINTEPCFNALDLSTQHWYQ